MGGLRTIPAFRGEFGLKLRYWVPQVHTLCLREPSRVEVEEGEEALFPAAASWVDVARAEDDSRRGSPPDLGVPETRFVPEPWARRCIHPDIVVCPRRREYGSAKNWDGWPDLVSTLSGSHDVFAAGAPDSSYEVPCPTAWTHKRFLDASIEAMRNAKLVIATDAGLAHLAVLCGAPLLLVTYRGLVAPGPVIDSRRRKVHDQYWPVRLSEYYGKANHTGAPINVMDGWESPEAVADEAVRIVGAVV
jgi:hypothetical protein